MKTVKIIAATVAATLLAVWAVFHYLINLWKWEP
jgi:hypothetical protein